jgi:hypothetical protein
METVYTIWRKLILQEANSGIACCPTNKSELLSFSFMEGGLGELVLYIP